MAKGKAFWPEIEKLMALGFSEYEARIYIELLQKSPATAYELSKRTGIARANAYGTCDSLQNKNAVEAIRERPVRFVPVPPHLLFANIALRTADVCNELESRLENLATGDRSGFIWSIEGEAAVNAKVREMIQGANESIWIKASGELLETHRNLLKDVMETRENLTSLIVLFGTDAERFKFNANSTVYLHEGSGVRLGNADNLFTISIDHVEALTARMGVDVQAAFTTHEPVVIMADTIIRHDVYMAEIFEHFGTEIEKKFGRHLYDLRKRNFRPEQFSLFLDNLKKLD